MAQTGSCNTKKMHDKRKVSTTELKQSCSSLLGWQQQVYPHQHKPSHTTRNQMINTVAYDNPKPYSDAGLGGSF
eukprot:5991564-Amphidinium_carterae.1